MTSATKVRSQRCADRCDSGRARRNGLPEYVTEGHESPVQTDPTQQKAVMSKGKVLIIGSNATRIETQGGGWGATGQYLQGSKVAASGRTHFTAATTRYSMTSSARPSSATGTSTPSALAVLRLITSSTLVTCCTGRSAGFSPFRIRPP